MALSISSVGTVPSAIASAQTGDAVAATVLKKSLAVQEQTAMQLLQALPQPTASSATQATGSLGNSINVFA